MAGLFDKLNVLLRANVNDFLTNLTGGDHRENDPDTMRSLATMARDGRVPAANFGTDIDQQITALRKKIDGAIDHQDRLQTQLDGLDRNVSALGERADTALQRGDDAGARDAQSAIQNLETQADLLRSELDDHRRTTSEFIERVNVLEAAVSDSRHAQGTSPSVQSTPAEVVKPAATAAEPVKPTTVKINVRTEANPQPAANSTAPAAQSTSVPAGVPATTPAARPSLSDVLRDAQSRFDSYLDEQLAQMESRRKSAEEAGERAMAQIAELDAKNVDKAEISLDTVGGKIYKMAGSDPMVDEPQNQQEMDAPTSAMPPDNVEVQPPPKGPIKNAPKQATPNDLDARRSRLTKPD